MERFMNPPISRHEALAPLSRDHYVGLVHANRLMKSSRADRVDRHKALSDYLDAWERDILPHFRDEERVLADRAAEADLRRMFEEHSTLAMLTDRARNLRRQVDPDPALLHDLGERLERHIRWEEQTLFNSIQERLTAEQLEDLRNDTTPIEELRARNIDRTKHTNDPNRPAC